MQRKIPDETLELMHRLDKSGSSVAEISRRTGVRYWKTYETLSLRERGYPSQYAYRQDILRKKMLDSKEDMSSLKKPKHHVKMLERRGQTYREHRRKIDEIRKRNPENQALASMIENRLEDLKKNQYWLAKRMHVGRGTISKYALGTTIPTPEKLQRLFSVLRTSYKTLDELTYEFENLRQLELPFKEFGPFPRYAHQPLRTSYQPVI